MVGEVEAKRKIMCFEDLIVWQEAQQLAVLVYKTTQLFPQDERFGITSQIRRAVASVSANIAEGFGRQTQKDKVHFIVIAYGSLLETKNFLYLAQKLGYITDDDLQRLLKQSVSCQKLINAYKRALK
jgi:four helix bundle protein